MSDGRPDAGAPAAMRTTYRDIFAVAEFRVVVASTVLMLLAETLRIVALSVLVFDLTGSPLLSAVTFGAGFIPQALGGTVLTALADRLPPRRLLVGYDVVQALATLALIVVAPSIWAVLALTAFAGCLAPLRMGATGALLPEILAGDRYVLGQSVVRTISAAMQVAGYATGGVLLAFLSPSAALLASAVAYAVSAVIWRLGLRGRGARAPEIALRSVVARTWQANGHLLRRQPRIRGLLLGLWLPVAMVTGAEATFVAYAAQAGLPDGGGGYLLAAMPVGLVAGDVVVARLCRPGTRARLALPLALIATLPLLSFSLRPELAVAAAVVVAVGFGGAYMLPLQAAFARAVPSHLRGRGFGLSSMGLMTGQGVGTAAVGAVASAAGPALAITAAGGAGAISVLLQRGNFAPHRLHGG